MLPEFDMCLNLKLNASFEKVKKNKYKNNGNPVLKHTNANCKSNLNFQTFLK